MKLECRAFFDLDTNEIFLVNEEEFLNSKREFEEKIREYQTEPMIHHRKTFPLKPPPFILITQTGIHSNWIYRPDQNYSKEVKKTNENLHR